MASLPSTSLFILSALYQSAGAITADWSASHIFNATWPPHAKFHTGQTISMSVILALLALYHVFRQKTDAKHTLDDLWTAMLVLNVYWVTQGMAFLVPGTHWCDEGFCFDAAFPPQLGIEVLGFVVNTAAYVLGRRALARQVSGGKKGL